MGKKHRIERCGVCRRNLDISEKLEIEDYDKSWRDGYVLVYCDECSNQIEVRI